MKTLFFRYIKIIAYKSMCQKIKLKFIANKYIVSAFVGAIMLIVGVSYSYYNAHQAANTFMGESLKEFELSRARIIFYSYDGEVIRWYYAYTLNNSTETVEIEVSLLGKIVFTNPSDLHDRLRKFERILDHHKNIYDK